MKFITKLSVLFIFSLSAVVLMACQQEDMMKKVVGTTWIYSFEDNKDGLEAYRPDSYEFPPARGREGWKFEENGTAKKQAIGPTDVYVTKEGKWTFSQENDKNTLTISLDNQKTTYEIVSVSDSILFVRPMNQN